MALDGLALAYLVRELRETLVGNRIDKIYQPEADEVVLTVKNQRLLITVNAQGPRVHLSNITKENPMVAPLFCMVLRKHLLGGRIVDIVQGAHFERVVNFDIQAVNEMGEMCRRRLIVEIMGKHSNVMLLDDKDVILDAAKRITAEMSSHREVLPGRAYVPPPVQDKMDPLVIFDNPDAARERLSTANAPLHKALYTAFMGISPGTAGEIIHRANLDADSTSGSLSHDEVGSILSIIGKIVQDVQLGNFNGELTLDNRGVAVAFAPFELTVRHSDDKRKADTMSRLLEDFYAAKDQALRISQKSQDLRRLVTQNIERCVRKYDAHQRTLRDIENRETHRLHGELLTANLHNISPGQSLVSVQNYYSADVDIVNIALDPRLTPAQNAQRYYKRYNKEKRAFEALGEQMAQNEQELQYLESVLAALSNADSEIELTEIREELVETGFVRRRAPKKGKERRNAPSQPIAHMSSDGFTILIGKNNRQNDELSMKTAAPDDIWLHAKDIPGSHVIVRTMGRAVPNQTLEEAAGLAAFYSKARASALVPVDYTAKKHVKKPTGAKPGMVIYTHQKTAFVKPLETLG